MAASTSVVAATSLATVIRTRRCVLDGVRKVCVRVRQNERLHGHTHPRTTNTCLRNLSEELLISQHLTHLQLGGVDQDSWALAPTVLRASLVEQGGQRVLVIQPETRGGQGTEGGTLVYRTGTTPHFVH